MTDRLTELADEQCDDSAVGIERLESNDTFLDASGDVAAELDRRLETFEVQQ